MSFLATHLIGFGAGGGASKSATFAEMDTSTASTSTHTFSAHSVGLPDPTRYIVVVIGVRKSIGINLTSVTVGGASCTEIVSSVGSSDGLYMYMTSSVFDTGTTADVVVTFSSNPTSVTIATYAVTALFSATATETSSSTTDGATMTLTATNGGVAIGGGYSRNSAGFTITGLTEDAEYQSVDASVAAASGPVTSSSFNVVFDFDGSASQFRQVAAGWI